MPPHAFDHSDTSSTTRDVAHDNSSNNSQSNMSVDLPLKSSLHRRRSSIKKRVSFGKEQDNEVHDVDHINDLEKEEDTAKIWYSDEEYTEIAKQRHETIERRIDSLLKQHEEQDEETNDEDEDEDEWCIRGLALEMETTLTNLYEDFTPVRSHRRRKAVEAVLEEQDQQKIDGVYDEELLAYAYFDYSQKSQMDASLVGLDDWKEAVLVSDS